MATLPPTVKNAISGSVSVMLASLAIPQERIDAALRSMFSELNGQGTRTLTNPEPLDRCLSMKQTSEIIGRSKKTIGIMVKNGKLRGIFGGANGQRLTGISEASVRQFMGRGRMA